MKIVIPVDEKQIETPVCVSFGRTPYFLLYDTETQKESFINNAAADCTGGAGIKAAQTIVDLGAEILLTPRCGENAFEVLHTAEVKIYKSTNQTAKENLRAFEAGELSLLDVIHAGFHGHGGR